MTTKGHCKSSLGSFDECSAAHKRPSTSGWWRSIVIPEYYNMNFATFQEPWWSATEIGWAQQHRSWCMIPFCRQCRSSPYVWRPLSTNNNNEKSTQRDANTAQLAVVRRNQKFSPAADPFPRAWDSHNLISCRWTFTYKPSLVKIEARNFQLSW